MDTGSDEAQYSYEQTPLISSSRGSFTSPSTTLQYQTFSSTGSDQQPSSIIYEPVHELSGKHSSFDYLKFFSCLAFTITVYLIWQMLILTRTSVLMDYRRAIRHQGNLLSDVESQRLFIRDLDLNSAGTDDGDDWFQSNIRNNNTEGNNKFILDKLRSWGLNSFNLKKGYNDIVYNIPGFSSDQTVILSIHRNDQKKGIQSPIAIYLDISHAFAELLKSGWKPLRSLRVVLWDVRLGDDGVMTNYDFSDVSFMKNVLAYVSLHEEEDITIDDGKNEETIFHIESNPLLNSIIQKVFKLISYEDSPLPLLKDNSQIGILNPSREDILTYQFQHGIPSISLTFPPNNSPLLNRMTITKFAGFFTKYLSDNDPISLYETQSYPELIAETLSNYHDLLKTFSRRSSELLESLKVLNETVDLFHHAALKFDNDVEELNREMKIQYPWFQFITKLKLLKKTKMVSSKIKSFDSLFLLTNEEGLNKMGRTINKHILFGTFRGVPVYLPGLYRSLFEGFDDVYNEKRVLYWVDVIIEKCRMATLRLS